MHQPGSHTKDSGAPCYVRRELAEEDPATVEAREKLERTRAILVDAALRVRCTQDGDSWQWSLEGSFEELPEGIEVTGLADHDPSDTGSRPRAPARMADSCSYEAERMMTAGRIASYTDPSTQQAQLLRLTPSSSGARSRQRLLLLLLPCLPLADRAHPLTASSDCDRRTWVRECVAELLAAAPDPGEGEVDERWEWAWPLHYLWEQQNLR